MDHDRLTMKCKKCDASKTVVLRKKDYYCDECFTVNINHKFRACIGKNKVIAPHDNVLICLSGGVGSTVLLDLIHYGISLDSTKKLRIAPFFLHILDIPDDDGKINAESVLQQCRKYNFDVYVVHISDYLNNTHQLPKSNCIPHADLEQYKRLQDMMKSTSPSAANDLQLKVKRNLFIRYAKLLQCKYVFTAEITSTLAVNLLCNIANGRGSQVQNDIGFYDSRDDKVKVLRPMKDITKEELDYYVTLKNLKPVYDTSLNDKSLQSIISSFVSDLQENFQSTISTICKTADKIGLHNEVRTQEKCYICDSDINNMNLSLSAVGATNISKKVSSRTESSSDIEKNIIEDENEVSLLHAVQLCYGCNRNLSEMNPSICKEIFSHKQSLLASESL